MIQYFDAFGRYEIPNYTLCNIDGKDICPISNIFNREVKMRYNALSEINFDIVKPDVGSEEQNEVEYWNYFEYRRLVHVDGIGYFMIMNHPEEDDGNKKQKHISCQSIDVEFQFKHISRFGKNLQGISVTYPLYNPLYNPNIPEAIDNKKDIVHIISERMPDWQFEYIDMDLISRSHRQFNISKSTLYAFMMNDVQKAYECVFEFNYQAKTIRLIAVENAITPVDIYLSHDNLVKNIKVENLTSELVTALTCYGKGNLSINQVNPIGGDTIYDFSYYMDRTWMSEDLIWALAAWEASIATNQPGYAFLMTKLSTANAEKLVLEGAGKPENTGAIPPDSQTAPWIGWGLRALEDELVAVEGLIAARIEMGESYFDLYLQKEGLLDLIEEKGELIESKKAAIEDLQEQLSEINSQLSMEGAFTETQKVELNRFIINAVYNNENMIQTDEMTPPQIQEQAQLLYGKGQEVLQRVSTPQYKFSVDSANFIFDQKFTAFTGLLKLGCSITIESNAVKRFSYPILLGIDFNYDSPTDFQLIFSNKLRLNDSTAEIGDILYNIERTINDVSFNSEDWGSWTDLYSNRVSDFINGSLDASLNNLVSSKDQELTINQNGLIGRRKLQDGTYDPKQVWLINNTLAFTKDNWTTAEMAVGNILMPNNQWGYGIVAPAVIGQLIAGSNLYIRSETGGATSPEFEINSSGAFLRNAKFSISNSQNLIELNPSDGIKITQKLANNTTKDIFKINTSDGSLTLEGNITANSGTFNGTINVKGESDLGGWKVKPVVGSTPGEISLNSNYYLKSDGSIKLGGFSVDKNGNASFSGSLNATSGSFTGHVNATSLSGRIDWSNIVNTPDFTSFFNGIGSAFGGFNLGGFTGGSLAPTRVGTGVWDFGGGYLGTGNGSNLTFRGTGYVVAGGAGLFLQADNVISLGNLRVNAGKNLYVGDSLVLIKTTADDLYAPKTHTHSQYYTQGSVASFTSVNASTYYSGGTAGATQSITVDKYGGGRWVLQFRSGILTGAAPVG